MAYSAYIEPFDVYKGQSEPCQNKQKTTKQSQVWHIGQARTCNDGSGLEGLAKAHVISQAAVQAGAA